MEEHQKPTEGQECAVCMDDIDESNYVEYRNSNDTHWIPCIICQNCVEMFLHDMMPNYKKNLLEADCRASQLRVLAQGPPIYVKDDSVFQSPEGEHVESLWFSSTGKERSAKVDGCLEGEEREKWWNEMKEILSITEEELKEREKWQKKPEEK
ncbi:hypothetical protein WA588_003918 [Blastocystis sp. NMH]